MQNKNLESIQSSPRSRFLWTRLVAIVLLGVEGMAAVGEAAASTVLFTQSFPIICTTNNHGRCTIMPIVTNINPSPFNPPVQSGCTGVSPNATSVSLGSSGHISFACGIGPAFDAQNGTATPTFTLPKGYTSLAIDVFITTPGIVCPSPNGQVFLKSGHPVLFNGTLTNTIRYYYCTAFASAPRGGLGNFTVTWSQ